MALVMLLPNICDAVGERLPEFLFILNRIICWKKPSKDRDENASDTIDDVSWPLGHRRESWEAAGMLSAVKRLTVDPTEDGFGTVPPKPDSLFTYIYGLYVRV